MKCAQLGGDACVQWCVQWRLEPQRSRDSMPNQSINCSIRTQYFHRTYLSSYVDNRLHQKVKVMILKNKIVMTLFRASSALVVGKLADRLFYYLLRRSRMDT